MRIEKASQPMASYVSQKIEANKKVEEKKVRTDSVDIKFSKAENNHSIFSIRARIDNASEIRQDMVNSVREKIEQGHYNSDAFADMLAKKLIDEKLLP